MCCKCLWFDCAGLLESTLVIGSLIAGILMVLAQEARGVLVGRNCPSWGVFGLYLAASITVSAITTAHKNIKTDFELSYVLADARLTFHPPEIVIRDHTFIYLGRRLVPLNPNHPLETV